MSLRETLPEARTRTEGQGGLAPARLQMTINRRPILPTLPCVAARTLHLLTGVPLDVEPDACPEAVRVIRLDPALTLAVLRQAAPNGRCPPTIDEAVRLAGAEGLWRAVTGTGVMLGSGCYTAEFWRHCITVALAAEEIARRNDLPEGRDGAYLAGLLHDVGRLVFSSLYPKSYRRCMEAASSGRASIGEAERRAMGMDHSGIGRRYAEAIGLPPHVVEAVQRHHDGDGESAGSARHGLMAGTIALADAVAYQTPSRSDEAVGGPAAEDLQALSRRAGLSPDALDEVLLVVPGRVGDAVAALGLESPDAQDGYPELLQAAMQRLAARLGRRSDAGVGAGVAHFLSTVECSTPIADVLRELAESLAADSADCGAIVCYCAAADDRTVTAVRRAPDGKTETRTYHRSRNFDAAGLPEAAEAEDVLRRLLDEPEKLDGWTDVSGCVHHSLPTDGTWLGGVFRDACDVPTGAAARWDELLRRAGGLALGLARRRAETTELSERLLASRQSLDEIKGAFAETARFEAAAELAAGAAHELNNPLAVMSGRAQIMQRRATTEADRETWRTIAEQSERVSEIVSELMDIASPARPDAERIDVRELLDETVSAFLSSGHPHAASAVVDIDTEASCPYVRADRGQIRRALLELLHNAVTAGGEGTAMRLEARGADDDDAVHVTVSDDGPGMDERTAARAFAPFFSKQKAGRRRGLGLARARRYVENNQGRIWIRTGPGAGVTVHVLLPAD